MAQRKQYQPSGPRGNPNVVGIRHTQKRSRFGPAMSTLLAAIHVRTQDGWDAESDPELDDTQKAMIRKARSVLVLPRGPLLKPRIWRSKAYAAVLLDRAEAKRERKGLRRLRNLPWEVANTPTIFAETTFKVPAEHVTVTDPERPGYPDLVVCVTDVEVARLGVRQACAEAAMRDWKEAPDGR